MKHKVIFGEMKRRVKIRLPSPSYGKRGVVETDVDLHSAGRAMPVIKGFETHYTTLRYCAFLFKINLRFSHGG